MVREIGGIEMERRAHSRMNINLNCYIETPDHRGQISGKAIVNISRNGILVRWTDIGCRTPAVGDTLVIDIPLRLNNRFGQRYMRCQCSVVRLLGSDGAPLVALKVVRTKFRPMAVEIESFLSAIPVDTPPYVM